VCGGNNTRVVDCVVRKIAQTFNAAGVEDYQVGTRGSP